MEIKQLYEKFLKETILNNTKIKEPITKGKIKWHGIQVCFNKTSLSDFTVRCWIEQRGVKIGEEFKI